MTLGWTTGIRFPAEEVNFLFITAFREALGLTQRD
jgi:hypothetical protein